MTRKKGFWIAGLMIILFFTAVFLSFDCFEDNGSAVEPVKADFEQGIVPVPYGSIETCLDLSQKNFLSLTKYGFRRKVSFDKTSFVGLCLERDLPSATPYNGLKYGIYRDKGLTNPTKEIDLQAEMDKAIAQDTILDIDEPEVGIEAELDPGTYYVAVYTNHFWDTFKILFLRYYIEPDYMEAA